MKTKEDSDIERRLLLAILLSMAVLFTAPYLLKYFNPPPPVPPVTETIAAQSEEERVEVPDFKERMEPQVEAPGELLEAGPATAAEPEEILVESELMQLRFTNVGASLASVRLKDYLADDGEDLELIPQTGLRVRPMSIYLDGDVRPDRLATAVFEVSGGSSRILRAPVTLLFEYRDAELSVTRRVHIAESGYQLDVETEVRDGSRSIPFEIALGAGIGNPPDGAGSDFRDPALAFPEGGSIERYKIGDLEEGPVRLETAARWAAIDSKFFTLLLFQPGAIRNLLMETESWTPPDAGDDTAGVELVSGTVGLAVSSSFTLFVGPKKEEELAALDPGLIELINYGWFGPLVRPLLGALKWINSSVGNYGWSIIILTFLINLVLFPIRYKQMASMKKMSALQPQLKSIQDKYKRMKKEDSRKQQMNTEVMALYKEHGVNPLGGCLPLVLQMPVLFAFFRMLDASIELRGAPFIFWIQDLSKADPYYVTPIVMGISMVAQQKMTPATGDATQRKMMMFLPVVFTFFFLNFSSGLVIYFLFSNLFAMMLQLGLQKFKPDVAVKKPAGKKPGKAKK